MKTALSYLFVLGIGVAIVYGGVQSANSSSFFGDQEEKTVKKRKYGRQPKKSKRSRYQVEIPEIKQPYLMDSYRNRSADVIDLSR